MLTRIHCPGCGFENEINVKKNERAKGHTCPNCGLDLFIKLEPLIVIVSYNHECPD